MYQPRAIPRFAVLILLWASVFQLPKLAVAQPSQAVRVPFTRTESMITMRDGIRLHTVVLTPQTQTEPLPIILNRTPYGVRYPHSSSAAGGIRKTCMDHS